MYPVAQGHPLSAHLLNLPAELRIKIIEYLLHVPRLSTTSIPHRAAAHAKGFTSGVGHVTFIQEGSDWHSVTIAGPPGLIFLAPGLLRTSKMLHEEAMEILYSKILWVINLPDRRPTGGPLISRQERPAIVTGPRTRSDFMQWVTHVLIRQHIRPEEDLLQKVYALRALMSCLNPNRKSTDVALHFDSIHLVNDADWPKAGRAEYAWRLYKLELASLSLGSSPQIRTSNYWVEKEGKRRFEEIAEYIGGVVDDPDFVYW